MDLRRLRPAEWLLTAAGIVLIVSLFLPWYGVQDHFDVSAWEAFSVTDALLLAGALVALLAVVLQATQRSPALPIVSDAAATWAGLVVTVLVIVKLIDPPQAGAHVKYGAWIALVGAVAVLAGGWLAMRDERMPGADAAHLESSG